MTGRRAHGGNLVSRLGSAQLILGLLVAAAAAVGVACERPVPNPVRGTTSGTTAPPSPPATSGTAVVPRVEGLSAKALQEASTRGQRFERLRRDIVAALPFDNARGIPGFSLPRACSPSAAVGTLDPHRSLFVHDIATLTAVPFTLERTLGLLATQISDAGVAGVTAQSLFRDLYDTQNPVGSAANPGGAHCDDNASTINGFPNSCPRNEGTDATNAAVSPGAATALMAQYVPVALVNRLDLAHEGWRNCGEHRIIYARTGSGGRNLLIFEAVLPNPSPGCKDACRPVAEMWASLSSLPDPADRARRLEDFYYGDTVPGPTNFSLPGFRPVVQVSHYSATGASSGYGSAGGGQIRTNQFMSVPNPGQQVWTLKELRTLVDCAGGTCEFDFVPDTVKLNPFAQLWSPGRPGSDFGARVGDFQSEIALQVAALGGGTSAANLSYSISNALNGAQSNSQFGVAPPPTAAPSPSGDTAYCSAFGCSSGGHYLQVSVDAFNASRPGEPPLTAEHIVNRATALSCGGCHMPSTFGLSGANKLGPGPAGLTTWPSPAVGGFAHVSELTQLPMPNPPIFGNQPGFAISAALSNEFLPARAANLEQFLEEDDCVCVPRFVSRLPLAVRRKLFPVRLPPTIKTPLDSVKLHQEDAKLLKDAQREAQAAGVKVPQPTPDARPSLGVTGGLANRADRRKARVKAVQKLVEDTPPRRTVTGSFRVH